MISKIKSFVFSLYDMAGHMYGRITGKHYFEDYIRVYPDGVAYKWYGARRKADDNDLKNFLNHKKFYRFAGQFVKDKQVADIGSGSGYGCQMLQEAGASKVSGSDISKSAVKFARDRFGKDDAVSFKIQSATALDDYGDSVFDVVISSEVLEHLKEYGVEDRALEEMIRIAKNQGLAIIGTPNSELLGEHGFSFEEINGLMSKHFDEYLIFENALITTGSKSRWQERHNSGATGLVVSQNIDLSETVLVEGDNPEIKAGIPLDSDVNIAGKSVDLGLLHNTHSWLVLAKIEK